jgi:hypothetical protein
MSRRKLSLFGKWRRKHFVSDEEAAQLFEVHQRTIQRWDYEGAPTLAMRQVDLWNRDLGGIHPRWKGWKIDKNGRLVGRKLPGAKSERYYFIPNTLEIIPNFWIEYDRLRYFVEREAPDIYRAWVAGRSTLPLPGETSAPAPLSHPVHP